MSLKLHDYQWAAVEHIVQNERCNLYIPMGLGKTISTLTAIDLLTLTHDVLPVLVLGPLRVINTTWPDEVAKWGFNFRVSVVSGTAAERAKALATPADIYCMNYDNLQWLAATVGDAWPFKMVVADECSKLKGYRLRQGSKRAQALAKHAHGAGSRYVGLSGTPSPGGLIDLWGQLHFCDKGTRLGRSFNAFTQRWFRPDWSGYNLTPTASAQGEIQEAVKDLCLSMNAADHFDLAEPIVNTVTVKLPPAARRQYDEMEKAMFTELNGEEVEAFSAAAKTMKCLQFANGSVYTDDKGAYIEAHDAKVQALESIIEEACGAPVIVAYHFKSDLDRLKKAFPKARVLDKNAGTIKDFNAGKIQILLAHPASAGHGINLAQGGNVLVFFSVNWSLEEHMQVIERIGPTRQAQLGSGKSVFLHYILAEKTVDQLVMQRLQSKKSVQEVLMQALNQRGEA